MDASILIFSNVGKQFDHQWVLKGINLQILPGASIAFIGPSGSGKSTILKMIAGLVTPDQGQITCAAKEVGMLFQRNALFDSFTCLENLLFPLKERKGEVGTLAHKKAAELLEAVGLAGTESLFPDEISGGMQKRLGIARALIIEPDLILYDDPTAGLDPITSRHIADLILSLRKKMGTTVISITNDMQRAYQLADEIYLVAQGKISGGGSPSQIRETTDPALRQFIMGLSQGPLTAAHVY